MFKRIRNYFSEEEKENRKERKLREEMKKRKVVESVYHDLNQEFDEVKTKYIKLLEKKSEKFDRFLEYHDLCKSLEAQVKDYKKEISDLKSEIKEYELELQKNQDAKNLLTDDNNNAII